MSRFFLLDFLPVNLQTRADKVIVPQPKIESDIGTVLLSEVELNYS